MLPTDGIWSVALEKEGAAFFALGIFLYLFGEKFLSLPVIPALAKEPSPPD